jgi:outer membrane immunogenic protein
MFRVMLLATASSLAIFSTANAADIYRPDPEGGLYKDGPVYAANTWTGFYAGVNGGYGWNLRSSSDFQNSPAGGFGGGQAGYNWQSALGFSSHLVLGVETDIQGAGIGETGNVIVKESVNHVFRGPRTIGIKSVLDANLDYFGTVRGRIGYAFDRTLVYFTGGFAYGGVDNTLTVPANAASPGGATFKNNKVETGYVLGGGLEHKINSSWSVKGEYQYVTLDNGDLTGPTGTIRSEHDQNHYNIVKVGLNYHLHQDFEPLK